MPRDSAAARALTAAPMHHVVCTYVVYVAVGAAGRGRQAVAVGRSPSVGEARAPRLTGWCRDLAARVAAAIRNRAHDLRMRAALKPQLC